MFLECISHVYFFCETLISNLGSIYLSAGFSFSYLKESPFLMPLPILFPVSLIFEALWLDF